MPPIKYTQFETWLGKTKTDAMSQIYLIYGESYLVKKAVKQICAFVSGKKDSPFAIEALEGGSVSVGDIIEEVATFSFLVKKKIVAVKNIPLFQPRTASNEVSFSPSDHTLFANFISGGMPENHYLILTCTSIDKRKKIYKVIEDNGQVIDCSVSLGARKADIDDQRQALKDLAGPILDKSKKTIAPQAFTRLIDLTGFNLELFAQNIDKLLAYSGSNKSITLDDVNTVIIRDKKDPIFHLTNAIMDKNTENSLFYLNSLLNEGFHPLQILKSLENQIRKLLLVKCFVHDISKKPVLGLNQMGFNGFKQKVLPKIAARDKEIKAAIEASDDFVPKEGKNKKKASSTDLLLAPNPQNPYPVYQVFLKSEKFLLLELNQALIFLSDLDYRLKSSAIDAKTQIENFIIHLCSKGGFVYEDQKH